MIKNTVIKKKLIIDQLTLQLLYSLARFIAPFAKHPYFCFAGNPTIGFAISRAESRSTNIAFGFLKQFL